MTSRPLFLKFRVTSGMLAPLKLRWLLMIVLASGSGRIVVSMGSTVTAAVLAGGPTLTTLGAAKLYFLAATTGVVGGDRPTVSGLANVKLAFSCIVADDLPVVNLFCDGLSLISEPSLSLSLDERQLTGALKEKVAIAAALEPPPEFEAAAGGANGFDNPKVGGAAVDEAEEEEAGIVEGMELVEEVEELDLRSKLMSGSFPGI